MFQEKDFEDILSKYPELIEEGLTFINRQVTMFGRRMDLIYEDRFKRKLIVELKKGPIKDDHIGQIMSYEGMLLSADDPTIRIMLIGNRVPPNIQRSLDHHGIAWREITFHRLREFLGEKNEDDFLNMLEDNGNIHHHYAYKKTNDIQPSQKMNPDELISAVKSSENYKNFKPILYEKEEHEELARKILTENLGALEHSHLREIIDLIDKPYRYLQNGKYNSGPWFGRLLQSNTPVLFGSDILKINNWFNILTNSFFSLEKKFALLLNEPNQIKGLNVGFITLMLYLLDKQNYCVWFEGLHDGYRRIYPETEKYTGKVTQYIIFNEAAKGMAQKYGFSHTELDWVFSTGVYLDTKSTARPIFRNGVSIYNQDNSTWINLDQKKYSISQIFEKQNANNEVRFLVAEFHKSTARVLADKNLEWWARTHIYGCTYFCNKTKAFMAINIASSHVIVRYYLGDGSIEGLERGTWANKEDKKASKPFRVTDPESIRRAIGYVEAAYRIAMVESSGML